MARRNIDLENVRERAIEVGLYLPLGAYSRIRDGISGLGTRDIRKFYDGLVERGQDRLGPVESAIKGNARRIARRADRVEDQIEDSVESAGKTVARKTRQVTKKATKAATLTGPKIPRVAAPKTASDLPIKGYDSLTAEDVISRTRGLTQTDLAKVYKYEKANANRTTVIDSLETRFVALPIGDYDSLTADDITARLDGLSDDELKTVRRYESDTKARSTVLDKIETKLS